MLDKQNIKILKKLQKLCPDGSYKVFDLPELLELFNVNKYALDNDFSYIKNNVTCNFLDYRVQIASGVSNSWGFFHPHSTDKLARNN